MRAWEFFFRLHGRFDAAFDQEPVHRIGKEEAYEHGQLHDEPETPTGVRKGGGEHDEEEKVAKSVHPDLPTAKGEEVYFQGAQKDGVWTERGQPGADGGVLKTGADGQGEYIIQSPHPADACQAERAQQERPEAFSDQVGQGATGAAVEGGQGYILPEGAAGHLHFAFVGVLDHASDAAEGEEGPEADEAAPQGGEGPDEVHHFHRLGVGIEVAQEGEYR